jgi:hypothetical protein
MTRNVDQLTAGQERMTREITNCRRSNNRPTSAAAGPGTHPRATVVAGTDGALTVRSDRRPGALVSLSRSQVYQGAGHLVEVQKSETSDFGGQR